MKNITINCDRCKKDIDGLIDNEFGYTAGFYNIQDNCCWSNYRRNDEKYVCDDCMRSDDKYIKEYGLLTPTLEGRLNSAPKSELAALEQLARDNVLTELVQKRLEKLRK